MINGAGFFNDVVEMYTDFMTSLNLTEAMSRVSVLTEEVLNFLARNMSKMWLSFVGIGLVLFFLNSVILGLSSMPSCLSLHLYMGSMTKQSVFTSFSECFGKSLKVELCYYLVTLPINVAYLGLFLLSMKLFNYAWYIGLLAVFVILVGFVLLFAFKLTLFSTWIPTMVVMNYGVWKSLKEGLKLAFRQFGRVFGNAIGVVITILLLNVIFGLFTIMVGLLLSVVISYVLVSIFGMVVVYEGQGMRYYVDLCNVITPKKKEISDKFNDMKYIV